MALLKLVCLLLAAVMVASLPEDFWEYDVMLEKVARNIKANTIAFNQLVSYPKYKPYELHFGSYYKTKFTKFSVTNTSVVGYENMKQAPFADGQHLGEDIIQFSGTLFVPKLRILGIINMEVDGKFYSAPFSANRTVEDEIMLTINYNKTSKSVKVVELKHKYGTKFELDAPNCCKDRSSSDSSHITYDMLQVARQYAFESPNEILQLWDRLFVRVIETTTF